MSLKWMTKLHHQFIVLKAGSIPFPSNHSLYWKVLHPPQFGSRIAQKCMLVFSSLGLVTFCSDYFQIHPIDRSHDFFLWNHPKVGATRLNDDKSTLLKRNKIYSYISHHVMQIWRIYLGCDDPPITKHEILSASIHVNLCRLDHNYR